MTKTSDTRNQNALSESLYIYCMGIALCNSIGAFSVLETGLKLTERGVLAIESQRLQKDVTKSKMVKNRYELDINIHEVHKFIAVHRE